MHIEGTKSSPSIDVEGGVFKIKGRSIPEDAYEFYSPLLRELAQYIENPQPKTEVQFHLEYINSGSKKYITNFLAKMNEFYQKGKEVIIYWHYDYDDESMQELGNDLRSMIQIPFHIVEV
ncbi:MAG: DUF1987 domain-containing protein [Bacteroidales bacterium]|nr:DUF1987 domain-containing protein [Bacteroidales bacterium]MCF8391181.1 DUF1987 domain-containing protein [Bacteroidales bacterium]